MYASDIPNVIGYLEMNGYRVMTDMTKMAYKMPVDFADSNTSYNNRKIVFMFKYIGFTEEGSKSEFLRRGASNENEGK